MKNQKLKKKKAQRTNHTIQLLIAWNQSFLANRPVHLGSNELAVVRHTGRVASRRRGPQREERWKPEAQSLPPAIGL